MLEDGKGRWVATTDFLADHVRPHVSHVIPKDNVLRYRFADTVVEFRRPPGYSDHNRVLIDVKEADRPAKRTE